MKSAKAMLDDEPSSEAEADRRMNETPCDVRSPRPKATQTVREAKNAAD